MLGGLPEVSYQPCKITRSEPWLSLRKEGWFYNRVRIDPPDIARVLNDAAAFWLARGEMTTPLYVAAEADLDISTLRKIRAILPPSLEMRLVASRDKPVPASEVPARLRPWYRGYLAMSPDQRLDEFFRAVERWIGPTCASLPLMFKELRDSAQTRMWQLGQELLIPALDACNCGGVDPNFDSVILWLFLPAYQHFGWIPLPGQLPATGVVADIVPRTGQCM